MKKGLFFILIIAMMVSCHQGVVYDKKQETPSPWKYGENIEFLYEIKDTSVSYNLQITIEHSSTFSFENVYLNTTTVFPDGTSTSYPVSFQLTNDQGEWNGKCNGRKCSTEIEMASDAYYRKPGKYLLRFEQFSRNGQLEGIYALTIKVVKANS